MSRPSFCTESETDPNFVQRDTGRSYWSFSHRDIAALRELPQLELAKIYAESMANSARALTNKPVPGVQDGDVKRQI